MFSHNGKISEKQMRRMLVLPTFASAIFVVPYLAARLFKLNVMLGMLIFFVFSCIYLTCIYGIGAWYQRKGRKGFILTVENGGGAAKILPALQMLRLIIRLIFYIVLSIKILGEAQVPFIYGSETNHMANLLVVLPLLLVAWYGANRKIEKQGRIHEMVFWVLFIPFIIVILFGLKEVDYSILIPHADMSLGKMLLYGYTLLTFILPLESYLYLRPELRKDRVAARKEKTVKAGEGIEYLQKGRHNTIISYWALIGVFALILVLTLFLLGIYGIHGAGAEEMVAIAIMRYIRLPFGVLERFDVLMVWFFMTGCFILICSTLYYAGNLLKLLWKRAKRVWLLGGILMLALGCWFLLPDYSGSLLLFLSYGALLDIPLSLIIPLLGMLTVKGDGDDEA